MLIRLYCVPCYDKTESTCDYMLKPQSRPPCAATCHLDTQQNPLTFAKTKDYYTRGSGIMWCVQWQGYGLGFQGNVFRLLAEVWDIVVSKTASMAVRPTNLSFHQVAGVLCSEVKRPESKADHSAPSSAKVKNDWSYTSTRHVPARRAHRLNYSYIFKYYPHITPRYFTLTAINLNLS
jgi:hypothetical protein